MTVLDLMSDERLLGKWFRGETWNAWKIFLCVLFGLHDRIDAAGMAIYRAATAREQLPAVLLRQIYLCCGRRAGKTLAAALIGLFLALFRDYTAYFAPGEVGTVMLVAADHRQARTIMRYIRGFISQVPMFEKLVTRVTRETIEFGSRHVAIEIHTASFRTVRSYTLVAVINDELCFWHTDDAADPDREVINAQLPAMSTIPNALMLNLSSPHAMRGVMGDGYQKYFGRDVPGILFWKAPSRALPEQGYRVEMNPTISLDIVRSAYEQDFSAALANWAGEFRTDVESLVTKAAVTASMFLGRLELPPIDGVAYTAFVDPAGGSGADSMTLAIAHFDAANSQAVLDCVRERRPVFSPDNVVQEFSATLKSYRVFRVTGDRYSGGWVVEGFRKQGIEYIASEKTKSELYLELVPVLNSGRCELLDNPRLVAQLCELERRTARGGRDSVDHGPSQNDDLANAAAGALFSAPKSRPRTWRDLVEVIPCGGSRDERLWQRMS